MKFTLQTVKTYYPKVDEREKLEQIGFTFRKSDFKINGSIEIEINSLEELIQLSNKFGEILIVEGLITIYDDYIE